MKYIKTYEAWEMIEENLYHSIEETEVLYSMLFHDKIGGSTPQEIDGKIYLGISCTKDRKFIYKNRPITIELDYNLSKKYECVDINFFDTDFGKSKQQKHNLEKETFIITGTKIGGYLPLSNYLISIKLNNKHVVLSDDIIDILKNGYPDIIIYNHLGNIITKKIFKNKKTDDYL